ncbi:UxaA family hydrolase [Blastopirellula marina]|uniref:Hydrolase, UxaA family protein n=1 Tax=Blastopirellula marina DSM 3645 TaxID=314230 RepID=A3ZNA0_9BACT|nr:altronate dehydratase family protein [Blastopirellula marina]EAQ81792.1 hydrolase, UxaA family protein [Blastopirellula marina DSM 3645]
MPPAPPSVIQLHAADNVAVAAKTLARGEDFSVGGGAVTAAAEVRFGHKIALTAIAAGAPIHKYGQVIGYATRAISLGEHVHSHNLHLGELHLDYASASETPAPPAPITGRTFDGYLRADGRAGTRNYIAVISTVNCSASVAKYVAHAFDERRLADFPNIDGVIPFTHQSGCAMQFGGDAHQTLNRVMAGIARHPNIGGYLLIGLGCETGAMGYLVQQERLVQLDGSADQPAGAPLILSMQDQGGTAKTIEAGVARLVEMLPRVNDVRRQAIPASEIVLATECGGSDAYSGVTANPAVGAAADRIVAAGGISMLAETPEIFGAEQLLTRRAINVAVADKLIERIEWWKSYVGMFGVQLDNNPSPGNKEGGLTTIAEKSLGAVAKAGGTALVDVLQYAEAPTARGLMVMDTPGYDPASVTGMVAGGANVVVFTTGRGSCFGCKPTPSIKIATNTPMYERMVDDMDINAGEILQGVSVDAMGAKIFEEILAVASGKSTKSEALGIGEEEFVPWLVGPTL